jgi:hypothetical protein
MFLALFIPNQEPSAENPEESIRFHEYYQKKTGSDYDMGNRHIRPDVDPLLDEVFGAGAAERLRGSVDQGPMLFFVNHFLQRLNELHPKNSLSFQKENTVSLFKDPEGKLYLRAVFDIQCAEDESVDPPLTVPFKVKVDSTFRVLETGVQFDRLELSGEEAMVESARRLLMADIKQFSLLERLRYTAKTADTALDTLINLVIISPQAAMGLQKAIEIGAPQPEFVAMTGENEKNIYRWLSIIGESLGEKGLQAFMDEASGSLMIRRRLREDRDKLQEKFQSRLDFMRVLTTDTDQESEFEPFSDSEEEIDSDSEEFESESLAKRHEPSPMLTQRPPGGSPSVSRPRRLRLTSSPSPESSHGEGVEESKGPGREETGQKPGEF